jgi:phage tail-like protein
MSYPLALYNFRVVVDTRSMNFAEVSGITIAYEHVVYRHGLSFLEGEDIATFRFDAFAPVTLKRGTIPNASALYLHDWLKKRSLRRMEIFLCDQRGNAIMAWQIAKAIPVKLSAPTFDAKSNEVAIDTLEVQARGVSLVNV